MFEQYFVKPDTSDRLRASWLAAEIEAYFVWLVDEGFSTKCIWRRAPIAFAFGEFARARGAVTIGDLAAHVDAFVAERVERHAERTRSQADGQRSARSGGADVVRRGARFRAH